MQSPLHPKVTLQRVELEPGLMVFSCPLSGGIWIPLQSYLAWHGNHRERTTPNTFEVVVEDDSSRLVLFCPESGCLLQRFRAGSGLRFQIDRSPVTGGIWLDRGEWDALKSRNLHEELHLIFSAPFQKRLRTRELEQRLENTFRERIGFANFQKAAEFKNWMTEHSNCRDILCFLLQGNDDRDESSPEARNDPASS